jgi:dihydrofolate reductase
MRKIVTGTFMTLDGVVEAPGSGDTTLPTKRGWTEPYMNEELGQFIMEQMGQSDAMLLGRVTYEGFAAFWPTMSNDDPFAARMNNATKYVVSNTLEKAEWNNTTLIRGNLVEEITKLKQQPGQNISITGSGGLIRSLLQHNLVDEINLLVFPVVLGVGKKLFGEGDTNNFSLVSAKTTRTGVVILTYQPAK